MSTTLSWRKTASMAVTAFAALASAACDRAALMTSVDEYLHGLTAGPTAIRNVAAKFTNIENNKTTDLAAGILSAGLTLDHNRTIVDLVDCATHTEIVATLARDRYTQYVVGVQMRHQPGDGSRLSELDSVVTTNGSWFFNATSTLQRARADAARWTTALAPAARSSRAELRRVADAYLDMWTDAQAAAAIPFAAGCMRLEGGNYYGCRVGIPKNSSQLPNSHRRYVVDEAVGSVDVISVWEHLNDTIDNHEFRLEGGKLTMVHAMAWTDNRKCGEEAEGWRCR